MSPLAVAPAEPVQPANVVPLTLWSAAAAGCLVSLVLVLVSMVTFAVGMR